LLLSTLRRTRGTEINRQAAGILHIFWQLLRGAIDPAACRRLSRHGGRSPAIALQERTVLDLCTAREDLQPANLVPSGQGVLARCRIRVCGANSAGRAELENFIHARFEHKHNAMVRSFLPVLIGLYDGAGRVVAAAGYRPADSAALYLEQYLGEGIEESIARRTGDAVTRSEIAEIGNLTSPPPTAPPP
jgi:hypothetical protein